MERTDPKYLELAIKQAWEQDTLLIAAKADNPPDTFDELEDIITSSNCNCFIREEFKDLLELIMSSDDPDSVVRELPFEWEVTESEVVGWIYPFVPRIA